MRVAVVGAGQACAPHFRSLQDLQAELELAWVIGRDVGRLAAVSITA